MIETLLKYKLQANLTLCKNRLKNVLVYFYTLPLRERLLDPPLTSIELNMIIRRMRIKKRHFFCDNRMVAMTIETVTIN